MTNKSELIKLLKALEKNAYATADILRDGKKRGNKFEYMDRGRATAYHEIYRMLENPGLYEQLKAIYLPD